MSKDVIRYYYSLGVTRMTRWFNHLGVHPFLGFISLLFLCLVFIFYIFSGSSYSVIISGFLTVLFLLKAGQTERCQLLKTIFSNRQYIVLRAIENLVIIFPLSLYLALNGFFIYLSALVSLSILMILVSKSINIQFVLPTPFGNSPFEFLIGIRKSLWIIVLMFIILYKSIEVGNSNLGLFVLGSLFFLSMSFYLKPEDSYYVWIYNKNPKEFIKDKLKIGFLHSSILTLPIAFIMSVFFPSDWSIILIVQMIGYLFLISIILAKYSVFPKEMNLPQGIMYALSLWFPPMLFVLIPIFYKKAKIKLKRYLL